MDLSKTFVDPASVQNKYNMSSTSTQYSGNQHSGYVPNILDKENKDFAARPYCMYKEGPSLFGDVPRQDLVGHIHAETPLNSIFFSQLNIDKLQQDIQAQVKDMSNGEYVIGRQNDDDLKIIMRSYYLMFSENNPQRVAEELESLNRRVVGYSAGKIYSEVDFHEFYLKDIQDFAPAMANPMNVGVYGTRTGELKSFF